MAKKKPTQNKKCCKKTCAKKSCESKNEAQKRCSGTLPELKSEIVEIQPNTKSNYLLSLIRRTLGYD